ncbi:hypothetical protein GQX74_001468, partial [Glossina fuscipes]
MNDITQHCFTIDYVLSWKSVILIDDCTFTTLLAFSSATAKKDIKTFLFSRNKVISYFTAKEKLLLKYKRTHIMVKVNENFGKLTLIWLIFLFSRNIKALRYSPGSGDENCETVKSEIHLIKEEFDELGRMQRTCNADVMVNKCEGLCNSQVQPSVITPTGFLKECYCCRESYLKERIVTLSHCYDPDASIDQNPNVVIARDNER